MSPEDRVVTASAPVTAHAGPAHDPSRGAGPGGRPACSHCGGNGWIPGLIVTDAAGHEHVVDERCGHCHGTGVEPES